MTAEERIKHFNKEQKKLQKLFKNKLDTENYKTAEGLIENAAFMYSSLKELQEAIAVEGYIEEYQNGNNQFGRKESTCIRVYNATVKNYYTVIKMLVSLINKDNTAPEDDTLMDFLKLN
nr:MAG: terminase, small subunit [Bacteriophage sp.]